MKENMPLKFIIIRIIRSHNNKMNEMENEEVIIPQISSPSTYFKFLIRNFKWLRWEGVSKRVNGRRNSEKHLFLSLNRFNLLYHETGSSINAEQIIDVKISIGLRIWACNKLFRALAVDSCIYSKVATYSRFFEIPLLDFEIFILTRSVVKKREFTWAYKTITSKLEMNLSTTLKYNV